MALSAPDSDGFLRFAPLLSGDAQAPGVGLALEPGDFVAGELSGWVRLDRTGWQYFDSTETIGTLKPAALARER